jgi:hypothetical protein
LRDAGRAQRLEHRFRQVGGGRRRKKQQKEQKALEKPGYGRYY